MILEVDLEYPPELHHLHNDYPLAPEKMVVREEMLSKYSQEILDREGMSIGKVEKLIPNLRDKNRCHSPSKFKSLFKIGFEFEKNSSCSRIFTKQLVGTLYCF